MASQRAGRLLPALLLACAASAVMATRLPDEQAFVPVRVKGARRYILQSPPALGPDLPVDLPVAEAPSDAGLSSLLNAPRAAPLAPAASLRPGNDRARNASAPSSRSSPASPPDGASSSVLGINSPATTNTPSTTSRSPPPASRSPPPASRSPPPASRSPSSGSSSTSSSSKTINEDKVLADGSICNIYSRSSSLTCSDDAPVPACCDEVSDDAICLTYDSGANLQCITSVPYPACCEARDQPIEVCDAVPTSGRCPAALPVPACCDDTDYCYVFSDASSTRCSRDNVAACCPA